MKVLDPRANLPVSGGLALRGEAGVARYKLPDGSLAHKQRFYHLHVPDTADDSDADGMRVDSDGRLYVATRLGLQIGDQAGRVNCMIPTPQRLLKLAEARIRGLDLIRPYSHVY